MERLLRGTRSIMNIDDTDDNDISIDDTDCFPTRDDITILGPDDPNKKRLGWKIIELGVGQTMEDYLSPEEFAIYKASIDPSQNQETDRADKYRGSCGRKFDEDTSVTL